MSTKLKDHLLKSSLPLELVVAELLEEEGLSVSGENSFIGMTENHVESDCSIDLHASAFPNAGHGQHAAVHFLAGCKYSAAGVCWVFAPLPGDSLDWGNAITCVDTLWTSHFTNQAGVMEAQKGIPEAFQGMLISDNGFDSKVIAHWLNQLRHALPEYMLGEFSSQSHCPPADLGPLFFVPLLVTTAEVRLLRHKLSLSAFQEADSLDSITTPVDSVLVCQPLGPQLEELIRSRYQRSKEANPSLVAILKELSDHKVPSHFLAADWALRSALYSAPTCITVLRLDSLRGFIKKVLEVIDQQLDATQEIASATWDADAFRPRFKRINGDL